jgi:hypothetical protein
VVWAMCTPGSSSPVDGRSPCRAGGEAPLCPARQVARAMRRGVGDVSRGRLASPPSGTGGAQAGAEVLARLPFLESANLDGLCGDCICAQLQRVKAAAHTVRPNARHHRPQRAPSSALDRRQPSPRRPPGSAPAAASPPVALPSASSQPRPAASTPPSPSQAWSHGVALLLLRRAFLASTPHPLRPCPPVAASRRPLP